MIICWFHWEIILSESIQNDQRGLLTVSAAFNTRSGTRFFSQEHQQWGLVALSLLLLAFVIWPGALGNLQQRRSGDLQIKQLFWLVKSFDKYSDGSYGSACKWSLRYVLSAQDNGPELCLSPLVSHTLVSKNPSLLRLWLVADSITERLS